MFDPSFTSYTYIGQALIGYEQCNWWYFNDTASGDFIQLWALADTSNEIKRMEITTPTGYSAKWWFIEVDVTAQDPTVFQVPALIQGVCNQESHISHSGPKTKYFI